MRSEIHTHALPRPRHPHSYAASSQLCKTSAAIYGILSSCLLVSPANPNRLPQPRRSLTALQPPCLDSTAAGARGEEGTGERGELTLIIHANVEQPTTGVNLNRESRAAPRPALSWFHGGITGQIEFKGAASSLHLLRTNKRNYGHCSGRVVAVAADLAATVPILYTHASGIYAFTFPSCLGVKLYFSRF